MLLPNEASVMLWLPVGNLKTGICSRRQAAAAAAGGAPERLTLTQAVGLDSRLPGYRRWIAASSQQDSSHDWWVDEQRHVIITGLLITQLSFEPLFS